MATRVTGGDATSGSFLCACMWKKIRMTRHLASLALGMKVIHRGRTLAGRTHKLQLPKHADGCRASKAVTDRYAQVIEPSRDFSVAQNRGRALVAVQSKPVSKSNYPGPAREVYL